MGQTTNQIEAHIEETQEDLSSNLHELERKVKAVVDWKQQFQTNPMTMLGVAFCGGIALAAIMGGGKNRRRGERSYSSPAMSSEPRGTGNSNKAMETWDNVKGALMGVAATRFTDFVEELVPGFQEQFRRTGEKAKAAVIN